MKKFLLALIIFAANIFPVNAQNVSLGGYTISSYGFNAVIGEDNSVTVSESITVDFSAPRHGIFRKLSLKNPDGHWTPVKIISVNGRYSESSNRNYKTLKIGDPNRTVIGRVPYVIAYAYDLGSDDTNKEYDRFYFNIIGRGWDVPVTGVSFSIVFPTPIKYEGISFSAGSVGSKTAEGIQWGLDGDGRTIKGTYSNPVKPGEALTIHVSLPEGYFKPKPKVTPKPSIKPMVTTKPSIKPKVNFSEIFDLYINPKHINIFSFTVLYISPVFVLVSFVLWRKYGRDAFVPDIVEYDPPKGMNSAEVALAYNGRVTHENVISLIVWLASKGYLKITEIKPKNFFDNGDFIISRTGKSDGLKAMEQQFMDGLMCGKDNINISKLADGYSFESAVKIIMNDLNRHAKQNYIFDAMSLAMRWPIFAMGLVIYMAVMASIFEYGIKLLSASLFIGAIFYICIIVHLFKHGLKVIERVFGIIAGLPFILSCLFFFYPHGKQDALVFCVGIICIGVMLVFAVIMPKRTGKGGHLLQQVRGFKKFLKNVEEPRIKALALGNPNWFYDILPYAYVLGVSGVWIKNLASLAMPLPEWYSGSLTSSSFSRLTSQAGRGFISTQSSSGFSSGSGSSGGGSGGGGGGSW